MSSLRLFLSRVWGLIRARQRDRDFEEEIAGHLEEAADEYVRQGLSPEDARRAALRSFGGVAQIREAWRDARSFVSLDNVRRDVHHAARALRRSAGFSVVVFVVLTTGTGAMTSVFALLNSVVLRPLPFAEPERLVVIRHAASGLGLEDAGLSSALYFRYLEQASSMVSLAVYRQPVALNLRLPNEGAERVQVTYASAALFKILGTRPAIGRLFTEQDGGPGFMNMRWQVPVLLSHRFWITRFGADPDIIGRVLSVNDSPREVVGVLPEGFAFSRADTQMWILIEPAKSAGSFTGNLSWDAVGRMRPGATAVSAQAELTRVLREIERVDADTAKARLAAVVTPLKSAVLGDVAQVIWLLFGAMAFLLVVAGANAGTLFLVRAEHRAREMAVRRALGAQGRQLARLFFIEALVLTSAAAVVGLWLANGILSAVAAWAPFELPRTAEIKIDGIAVLFTAAIAVSMAAFYGVLSIRRPNHSLSADLLGGQWATGGRGRLGGPHALIVVQVALALTLMAGSGLMVRTYQNLSHRELGFSPHGVLTFEISLPGRKARQHVRIYHDVVEHIRGVRHVDHVSAASFVPLTANEHLFPVQAGAAPVAFKFFVPGYFEAMGTPILDGDRFAAAGEHVTAQHPVLISAPLARRLYPGERAVGKTIRRLNEDGSIVDMARGPVPPFTIAGVVADVRETTLREGPSEVVYIPVIDPAVEQSIVPTNMRLVVRSAVPASALAAAVRQAIAEVDPDLSVGRIETMDAIVGAARAREALVGALLLVAAAVSLFLGAIGIYGSVAQVVRRRTREIGIRSALGAAPTELIRMVTAESARAVLFGLVLGLGVSLAAARMLGSLMFGVEAHDPVVLLTVTGILMAASGVAALLAARHAAGIAVLAALRCE
jgi:putative ABC transport system permease protein